MGIALTHYHKIERGEVDINTEKIATISQSLGVSPAELIGFDEKNVVVNHGNYASHYGTLNNYVNEKLYESQQELINSLKRENELLRKQANQAQ